MKKIVIILLLLTTFKIVLYQPDNCNIINDRMGKKSFRERIVNNFAGIPIAVLVHLNEMGRDSSSTLNEFEAMYLNYIFAVDSLNYTLSGKKIGFTRSKIDFFADERERYYGNTHPVVATLYIFDAKQKKASGGYDAAIVCWSKFILPFEQVVETLKKSK